MLPARQREQTLTAFEIRSIVYCIEIGGHA